MQPLYALLIAAVLLCSYYIYIERHNNRVCIRALQQYKVLDVKLPTGSILLFAGQFAYTGQQLFYSYANNCFTHIAVVVVIEGQDYVLEINPRSNHTWISDNIMPRHLIDKCGDITLSYLHERVKTYNGTVFACTAKRVPKTQTTMQKIDSYMDTIQYYTGQNLLSMFINWRTHCHHTDDVVPKTQHTCVDFTYQVLTDMGLLPPMRKTCQMPHEVSSVLDEDGQRLFSPPIRLS